MAAGDVAQSRFRQRLSSHNLKLDVDEANKLANVARRHCRYDSPECRTINNGTECYCPTDVKDEGKELFTNFVQEEIRRSGLEEIAKTATPWGVETPQGYLNPKWAKAGRELRQIADAFAKTKERQKVKERANSIDVADMTSIQFTDLLHELFLQNAITVDRIVVLFFFCSDLALNSLKCAATIVFERCIKWACDFIVDTVCEWVMKHGGWRSVFEKSVKHISPKQLLGVAGVLLAIVALYKLLKKH